MITAPCGARLETACPACHQANRTGAKFCRHCGHDVGARPAASAGDGSAPPADAGSAKGERKVTVRFADQPELDASSVRTFRYLVNEDAGCSDVTQFLGIVQPSKAPSHSHPYDEVGYIVEGEGIAHIEGVETPLRAGSCFHLAPRQVHTIENSGSRPMRILGVFHPSGSPAIAYEEKQ